MVGCHAIILLCCAAILLGFTWDSQPGDVTLKGSAGFTFTNFLSNVKGANWSDPYNFSDLRMGNALALGAGGEYFARDWLSLRGEVWWQPKRCGNCIKQQAVSMTKIGDGPAVKHDLKGWKGDAITLAPSVVFHAPCLDLAGHCLHVYGGGGPTFTMSRLGDQHGYTDSNDWGIQGLGGAEIRMTPSLSLFAEVHHKEDYMDCEDLEGCFRGRRYVNVALFGVSWTFGR